MIDHDGIVPARSRQGERYRISLLGINIPHDRERHYALPICILILILTFPLIVPAAAELPGADFTADPSSGPVPLFVQFTDTSTGMPTTWLWDFGDGTIATGQHPIHTFTSPGTYTVNLTATNPNGNDTVVKPAFIIAQESGPHLVWGPYLTLTSATGTTVNVKTDIPSLVTVAYATDTHYQEYGDYDMIATDGITAAFHRVALTGLEPGTLYHYRIVLDGALSDPFHFRTFPESGPFTFVVYSDTQDQLPTFSQLERHKLVAGRIAEEEDLLFVIHCGDLVNNAANLSDWDRYFAAGAPMMANTTVYPALGNHEANHTNYYEIYGVPQWYSFDCARAHFSILDTNSGAWDRMPEQSAWLADDLAGASGSLWRFVAFHHPPYSSERNHFGGWENVRTEWEDEFMSYGVDAVFSGHVHAYERFLANGIHYLVVATGGGPSYNLESPRAPFSMNSLEYALAYAKVTLDPAWGIATIEIIRVADISSDLREVTTVYPAGTIFETVTLGTPNVPVSEFTANTTAGPAPLTVQFTDLSTGYRITGRTWDLDGDGMIDSLEQDPVHTYTAVGTYTVNLTVTNTAGSSTEEKIAYITVTEPAETVLSLAPAASWVSAGDITMTRVLIGPLPRGLAGYNLTLELSNPSVAGITGITLPGWAVLNSTSALPAGQLVFGAVDLGRQVQPGADETLLAEVHLRGETVGSTDLLLHVAAMDADGGDPVIPTVLAGTVTVYRIDPFPGSTNRPTDPDGDGLYEDINGNGELDFDDVVAFYQNMAWVAGNTAVGIDPYDFNGNGRIDYDDVVVLYYRILGG
ncbi:cell surface protein [hydrocarbon metagenome]|uniref:Cell surface protein n=1 Tax=hydrocarbon metagenome TaxID=938273 RepID=A0A0W8ENC8_9ZZZZ